MAHRATREAGRHRATRTPAPRHVARHKAPKAARRARPTVAWRPQLVLASSVTVATTALLVGAADPSEPDAATPTGRTAADGATVAAATTSRTTPISRGGDRAQAAETVMAARAARVERARAAREARAAEAAARAAARRPLPDWLRACQSTVDPDGFANGELPDDSLCLLPDDGHQLETAAARAWWRLDRAYAKEFGEPTCLTDTYRSLEQQYALRAAKPTLTADPGTSTHGWGTAIDFCGGVESFGTPQHVWMRDHAPRFGWVNPDWAQQTGSMPEAWHWEHLGS